MEPAGSVGQTGVRGRHRSGPRWSRPGITRSIQPLRARFPTGPTPVPFEYQNASLHFDQFLVDARDNAGLATTNMAWNMVVGVLHTFRRRLAPRQVLRFGSVLPPVVRALYLEGWEVDAAPQPFTDRTALLAEVRAVRHEHNFSPDNAISAVAAALRKRVDQEAFDRVLGALPEGARDYWS
ncbi:DUF2267 domain-containing protein [Xylophilus sp. ASV27]|uniref:DUF2267 domain-containing protein n=1 Tax=Xylophilus sp. ASV27 TaxID=2795129 RepID=UPI0018EE1EFC|nr:DUF2267 domain-containing protein [Xylophilus sp. ASV27]